MLLLYSHITSPRLQFICHFIFKEMLGVDFTITIDSEEFKNYTGLCFNYSELRIKNVEHPDSFGKELRVQNTNLLFENDIKEQTIECFEINGHNAFFKTEGADFPFDIFAASFYLLSRYEEYLPHKKDMYGRYAHENSLAFKKGFLNLPLINIWVKDFAETIKSKFPDLEFRILNFEFIPTYDIDIAYSYKHKGLLRNIGGFFKSPSAQRIKVLLGLQKDPFDAYDWLDELHRKNNLQPLYFFLAAEKNGVYDKNILPHKDAIWQLIKRHAKKYTVGIHPSWQSSDNRVLLKKEIKQLEAMIEDRSMNHQPSTILYSRQHYIRFTMPETYRRLQEAGITNDYTMGYGSINGFRASVAASFYWYDLEKEEQTGLRIHPFCFMEANSYYEQKYTAAQAMDELMHYYKVCKAVNGQLIAIWHNNFLGTDKKFAGWREVYEFFVKVITKEK